MKTQDQGPVLIVIDQLVDAFLYAYEPSPNEWDADEVFTVAKLRQFFNAFAPAPGVIDPIGEYLRILSENGFSMHVTCDGLPAIFVSRRT